MYWKIIAKSVTTISVTILAAATGYFAWKSRNQIRESVAEWLREQDLQDSALMKAWIVFDKLISGVHCCLMVETKQTGIQQISQKIHSLEEIRKTDPDVYRQLQRLGYAEKDVMPLL